MIEIKDKELEKLVLEKHDYTLNLRRHFHEHPEIGLKEYETTKKIREELDKAGIAWIEASETGTIGIIEGDGNSDNILALRGDIDALNVVEPKSFEFRSKNEGLMHACGHDAHTATLLSAGIILKQKYEHKFPGKIYLLFQPGEETAAGAKAVIGSGKLNDVKAFYGQHVWSPYDIGKVGTKSGSFMTGARIFNINVIGKGGHGSTLETTKNPLVAASAIVLALQTITSNNISAMDSAVVCVGGINGGKQFNAICDDCKIIGTTRFTSKQMDATMCSRIEEIAENTAKAYGCQAVVEYGGSISALRTDDRLTEITSCAYKKVVGEDNFINTELIMGSEDFAEYCDIAPCAYGFIGCRNETIGADKVHHSSKFKIDEDCLDVAVATYIEFVKEYYNLK
ncbi:MAG: amidohydrolase [Erysipelotrichaceae bacterium]|nr:amidohydrolase [Erysipelotrichaceae bacterium]